MVLEQSPDNHIRRHLYFATIAQHVNVKFPKNFMSTQGNVIIWNYTKLTAKFPEVKCDETLQRIIGGFLYDNPFVKGEKLLVTCDGDNLCYPTGFSPYYEPEDWVRLFSRIRLKQIEKKRAIKILRYLLNECYSAEWQVW